MSYESNPAIDRYLTTLSKELADMAEPERSEVIGEIRNHAAEAVRAGEEPAAIIERFGDPRLLARAYKMELAVKSSHGPLRRVARFFAMLGLIAITSLMSFVTLAVTLAGVAGIFGGILSLVLPGDIIMVVLPIPQTISELLAIGFGILKVIGGLVSGVLLFFYVRMVARAFRHMVGNLRSGRR